MIIDNLYLESFLAIFLRVMYLNNPKIPPKMHQSLVKTHVVFIHWIFCIKSRFVYSFKMFWPVKLVLMFYLLGFAEREKNIYLWNLHSFSRSSYFIDCVSDNINNLLLSFSNKIFFYFSSVMFVKNKIMICIDILNFLRNSEVIL